MDELCGKEHTNTHTHPHIRTQIHTHILTHTHKENTTTATGKLNIVSQMIKKITDLQRLRRIVNAHRFAVVLKVDKDEGHT